ncbi:hypothetical protein DM02DRAFT_343334 [Periconia macrospinosa]|uniref:Uncharacterized protein n=1 Tax=Periconia macrospinosa TaxID=97972 RepID=A0A2V1DTP5_9PLEO|nr:hypothetical protein DM02DRAFT_343334 [Periconia macrospinosa]
MGNFPVYALAWGTSATFNDKNTIECKQRLNGKRQLEVQVVGRQRKLAAMFTQSSSYACIGPHLSDAATLRRMSNSDPPQSGLTSSTFCQPTFRAVQLISPSRSVFFLGFGATLRPYAEFLVADDIVKALGLLGPLLSEIIRFLGGLVVLRVWV